jgi:hypothetical protein
VAALVEPFPLISLTVAGLLVLLMVTACVRNQSLLASERLRWGIGLLVRGRR